MKPLVIELFAGCFGWSAGWLELGGRSIGFDIEHLPHHGPVPNGADLVLQDVRTIHGSQFKNADLILASPPCTEYSYFAMPWSRAKQIAAALKGQGSFPEGYTGSRNLADLNALFNACFRIQREAIQATGHDCPACYGLGPRHSSAPCARCNGTCWVTRHIPLVVENVKGAQPWVGPAKGHYGSFYLWGDVESVGGRLCAPQSRFGQSIKPLRRLAKNGGGGSWWPISHGVDNGEMYGVNPVRGPGIDGVKAPGNDTFRSTGHPCGKLTDPRYPSDGDGLKNARNWWSDGAGSLSATTSSHSPARKAASAQIAKIPLELSRWVARVYKPELAVAQCS